MTGPGAAPMLAVWDDCHGRTHSEVALRLLALDEPGATPESLAGLSVGERDARLLDLRERLAGPDLDLRTACPSCETALELTATVDEFRRSHSSAGAVRHLERDGVSVSFVVPSTADLASAMGEAGADSQRRALWRTCVRTERDGHELELDDTPSEIVAAVEAQMLALDEQAVAGFDLECPECSHPWTAEFDVVRLLWAELDASVHRLLSDVHRLADAYGWSEAEILDLSPRRRQFYLDQQ